MNISYTLTMNKAEMDAARTFAEKCAQQFGEAFNGEELNMSIEQKMKVKFTAGNLLAFFRLKDTYEVSMDLHVDESYMVDYLDLAARALPLFGGLINVAKELNTLHEKKFEILESDIETL